MCMPWNHKWKEKERREGTAEYYIGGKTEFIMIIQECSKCGKLKKVMFP